MHVKRRWLTLQTHHFESLKHSWAPTRRKRMKDGCARTWSCFDQRNDRHVQRLGATLTDRRSPLHLSKLHAAHGYSERLCSLGMLDEASRKIWVSSLRPGCDRGHNLWPPKFGCAPVTPWPHLKTVRVLVNSAWPCNLWTRMNSAVEKVVNLLAANLGANVTG